MIVPNKLNISAIVKNAPDDYTPLGKYGLFELLGIKTQILNMNPLGVTNGDDCTVKATCVVYQAAQGLDIKQDKELYDFLYGKLSSIGLRQSKLMNVNSVLQDCLDDFGFKSITFNSTMSLGTFLVTHKQGIYLVGVEYHCFAYIDGVIYDSSEHILHEISHMLGFPVEIVFCSQELVNTIFV